MNKNKNYVTLKWFISIILSVGIGTFIMNILGIMQINVWITRFIGMLVTVMIGLLFYYLWIRKNK